MDNRIYVNGENLDGEAICDYNIAVSYCETGVQNITLLHLLKLKIFLNISNEMFYQVVFKEKEVAV